MREAQASYERMFGQARSDLSPFRQMGGTALNDYYRLLGSNTDADLRQRRDQMMSAINAKAGSRGGFYSSARAKALGVAEGEYQNAREQRMFDRLGFLSQLGGAAAASSAGSAGQFGQMMGGASMAGNAGAAGHMAGAGMAWGQGLSGAMQGLGSGLSSYGMYQNMADYHDKALAQSAKKP
jgi:hypothetical protein